MGCKAGSDRWGDHHPWRGDERRQDRTDEPGCGHVLEYVGVD